MTAPPKRRWFRFSLRTMFVVVTIFGVWLGWQLKIVRERKAIIAELNQISPKSYTLWLSAYESDPDNRAVDTATLFQGMRVSWIRRLFGDDSCIVMDIHEVPDAQLAHRWENAFPEAQLAVSGPGVNEYRDSLRKPFAEREPNKGTIFKTGLIEK